MRLDERRIVDQVLVAEEACIGAVFCTFTFDPAYFEEQVLRSLLRLQGDPNEDAARYHEEARRALQNTPVACLVDAAAREAGRRLPYDVHLVRRRTFHPKVILVLYESEARLAVGSGNTTKSGLEQNTELFFVRSLRYAEPADAAVLRDVDELLAESAALAGTPGTQLAAVREALANRLEATPPLGTAARVDIRFVSSFRGRLLDQLSAVIPESAKITRVGVLAPFFERDDFSVAGADGLKAVLAEILALRPSRDAVLDVGAPWEDALVAAPPWADPPSLDEHLGSLWAWRKRETVGGATVEKMEYFVVDATAAKRIQVTNGAGERGRYDRDALESEISDRRLWRVAQPTVHAPKNILLALAAEHSVRLWLHPAAEVAPSGRIRRRPLHAKALLVTAVQRGRTATYGLIGSANASRSALARGVAQGGNVEAGVLCRFDGEVTIHDLLPSLVSSSVEQVNLVERETPTGVVDLSAWIDEVVHDARARTLSVHWRNDGPASLGEWTLGYLDRELAHGHGPPTETTLIADFELDPKSAEVTFTSAGEHWYLPIRVLDLAELPTSPTLASPSLREILALLGRRVGGERLATLRAQRGPAGVVSVLDAVFGEGFGPTDVFKAWWGAVEDLRMAPTIAAFRHRLIGPTGVCTAWQHLKDVPEDQLSRDEVWVYGCELLRELRGVEPLAGADSKTKSAMLAEAMTALLADLHRLAPDADRYAWLNEVSRFYDLGGRDDA
jgi:hypothetical protein